ncbi:hypothetical protein [Micromonospora sp. DT47]|uniref:hypothetical protein n=1 Tax=Micromonospora sp. DT47 TaxID=3393431 RepID=UPI003CF19083
MDDLMALADRIGGIVATNVSDSDRERIEAELRSDLRIAALRDRLNGRTPAPATPKPLTSDQAIAALRDRLTRPTGRVA